MRASVAPSKLTARRCVSRNRLVDLVVRNLAAGLPAPKTTRRVVRALLEHQEGQLDDDASLLLIHYHPARQDSLLPG